MDFGDELEGQRIDLLQRLDEENSNRSFHEINSECNVGDEKSWGFLSDDRSNADRDFDLDLEAAEDGRSDASINASSSAAF